MEGDEEFRKKRNTCNYTLLKYFMLYGTNDGNRTAIAGVALGGEKREKAGGVGEAREAIGAGKQESRRSRKMRRSRRIRSRMHRSSGWSSSSS